MTKSDHHTNQNVQIECLYPILNVEDLQASLAYYTKILGFKEDWSLDTLAQVSRETYGIMLNKSTETHPQEIWIGVEALEPFYEEFTDNGALFDQQPANHPWAYDMKVKDLDGHLLWFGAGSKSDMPYED